MKNIIRYCGLLLVGLVSCMEDEAPSVELNVGWINKSIRWANL